MAAGKFLGFMLTSRGIEANPDKCETVLKMQSPTTLKEIQRLSGRLTTLSQFIPRLVERVRPVLRKMKKGLVVKWDAECEQAFQDVKAILMNLPVMNRPTLGEDLQIFMGVSDSTISAVLTQEWPEPKLVYFISRTLQDAESRYQQVEKVALAFLNASRRLRPYFQSHQVEVNEEWNLYVDGASGRTISGSSIVLEGPNEFLLEHSLIFKFKVSNNQAEYEVLVAGQELARDMGARRVVCRTDSQLVVGQMNGEFQVKEEQLLRYFYKATTLAKLFDRINIRHIPRENNTRVDILSKLSSSKEKEQLTTIIHQVLLQPSVECMSVADVEERDWRSEIRRLMTKQDAGQPVKPTDARKIARYLLVGDDLYSRGFSTPFLKCLGKEEACYVMDEVHNGICGFHTGRRTLKARILRARYYWPTMEEDTKIFVQKCLGCQAHANNTHLPPNTLHTITSPWSFAQWGMDIVGPFPVQKVCWKLICRFGLPRTIITDNGRQFIDRKLAEFYTSLGIKHVTSSVEHPQTNNQVESMNKTIVTELKKRLGEKKGTWVDELPEVLWAYRCTPHRTTGESPFNLTYGTDAMLLVELGEPSLRRQVNNLQLNEGELRVELDSLEELRDRATLRAEACKRMVERKYNSKVRPRNFQEGDLVWRKTGEARRTATHGQHAAKWEGPFRVTEALGNGAYRLLQADGRPIPNTWNATHLKSYFS
ncbi:uncharacterized protein LOC108330177 [Vigna angularis]|uniref:uncharacterized protein LOC108330177 n=1 Tax=Phaseolus angularis TaxID=3914 RepID=UPI000809F1DF|nr:uncharacterized protein LOC108330177 [Vigna angularis]